MNSTGVLILRPKSWWFQRRNSIFQSFFVFRFSGGLTMEKITRLAATRIQALYRSYKIRQSFQEHKDLLLKHERLRSSRKTKKISSSIQRNKSKVITQAGSFLGHVIEEKHKTASLKNWPLWSKQKNKLTEITVHTIPNLLARAPMVQNEGHIP